VVCRAVVGTAATDTKTPGDTARALATISDSSSNAEYTAAEAAAQRACSVPMRQANRLERHAGILAALGQRNAALRLSALAGEMREVMTT